MYSELNPEAPEFYPDITSLTQNAYKTIRRTVMSSNALPSRESYDFFKTFTDFNTVTCQLSEYVVVKSNKILSSEMPAVKLKIREVGYNTEIVLDMNNKVLDRIEIKMDSLKKGHTVNTDAREDVRFAGHNVAPWNYNPVLKKIQVGSTTLLGAKNIPRPQLTFKDPVDNTDSLWVPKILDKPNNIKPLALNIIYNDRGEAVGYEHPYKVELELYEPPPEFLAPAAEPLSFPPPMDQTKYTYIDTESKVDELVEHLNTVKEIAVDVEHHSYRTYQGITCLIQISTDQGGDFIIDALAVREHIHKLNLSFTDPRKLKVFHGADKDVLWLQRDFGVYIVGLFDTFRAARSLRTPGLGLKNLLKHYCDVEVDKKYQLADWRIRPLPAELVEYARQDTHYLLYVWRRMRAELLATSGGYNQLRAIFHRSKVICAATYNKMVMDDTSHLGLYVKSRRVFNSRQMAALKMLYRWRDEQARLLDESVTYLIPNHMMLALAEALPREVQGVNACCNPMPPFVKQNIIKIHRMLLSCREMPLEPVQQPGDASTERGYLAPVTSAYDVHDVALDDFPNLMREDDIILDQTNDLLNDENEINIGQVHVTAITSEEETEEKINFVSNLNVQAKTYIPPYNRHRGSRHLAKEEEMRDMKSKEAKITAIAQGDQLIKVELLLKLQESKKLIENEQKNEDNAVKDSEDGEQSSQKKIVQRKRKMSTEKAENKSESNTSQVVVQQLEKSSKKEGESKAHDSSDSNNFKPYNYNNVNFTKYRQDCDKSRKEPKMKFKKHNQ